MSKSQTDQRVPSPKWKIATSEKNAPLALVKVRSKSSILVHPTPWRGNRIYLVHKLKVKKFRLHIHPYLQRTFQDCFR